MKDKAKFLTCIVIGVFLCVSILTACDFMPVAPNQEQMPSNPLIDGGDFPTDPTQEQTPSDPTDGENNTPDDSDQGKEPNSPENDDSSFMDGDDHVEFPFG